MNERRLGGCVWGVVAVWACVLACGGCAQGDRADAIKNVDGARADGAGDLLARSAAGMGRVLSGEQKPASPADDVVVEPVVARSAKEVVKQPVSPVVAAHGGEAAVPGQEGAASGAVAEVSRPGMPSLSGWWGGVSADGAGGDAVGERSAVAQVGSDYWKPEASAGSGAGGAGDSFRISGLALCSRVDGFGKYAKVESVRATGRPVPLLVYSQVDGFSYRTRDGSLGVDDGKTEWVVELGQSVVVYRMGSDGKSDVQVRVEPEQVARDVATFKRRDHFLVQRIELPVPLVAGKYVVKVTLRDKATGMVDERVAEVVVR